jgi:hypothetical protein
MTAYFIRFSACEEWLKYDLERGYSFSQYEFYPTREDALESDAIVYFGWDPDCIAQNSNGQWGIALDGLCGFGPFDSIEEAEEAAWDKGAYLSYDTCGIYTGRYVGIPDGADGDMFAPLTLEKVFCTEAIAS